MSKCRATAVKKFPAKFVICRMVRSIKRDKSGTFAKRIYIDILVTLCSVILVSAGDAIKMIDFNV